MDNINQIKAVEKKKKKKRVREVKWRQYFLMIYIFKFYLILFYIFFFLEPNKTKEVFASFNLGSQGLPTSLTAQVCASYLWPSTGKNNFQSYLWFNEHNSCQDNGTIVVLLPMTAMLVVGNGKYQNTTYSVRTSVVLYFLFRFWDCGSIWKWITDTIYRIDSLF